MLSAMKLEASDTGLGLTDFTSSVYGFIKRMPSASPDPAEPVPA